VITINDEWEILCNHHECMYLDGNLCYGGIYQCPHIAERARVSLGETIKDYEEFKQQEPYGDEYYSDLAWFEHRIQEYQRLAKDNEF